MSPREKLEEAIKACGSQAELARRLSAILGRRIQTGHIYYMLRNGVAADVCAPIEAASGIRCCEIFQPDLTWHRDAAGQITGYTTPVPPAAQPEAA